MKYAVLLNNIVVNIAVWDGVSDWNPGAQFTLVKVGDGQFVDMGWIWDGTNFNSPT